MIKKLRNSLALLFFLSSWININAQNILSGIKYQLGAGAYLSGKTPFWMKANQYGLVPLEGPFITVQGRVAKEYDSTKKEFQKITGHSR